jgi:hypothetical protein
MTKRSPAQGRKKKGSPMSATMLECAEVVGRAIDAVKHVQGQGILPIRDVKKLRAHPAQLMTKNRFDGKDSENLTIEQVKFGRAMKDYLRKLTPPRSDWTSAEVLDVLMILGYRNHERNYELNVHRFTLAIEVLKNGSGDAKERKRTRRLFPSFGEVLYVAMREGWYLRAEKVVLQ